jgi:hypothetical protein
MNPQPSEAMGAVWAIIFVFGIAFFALKTFLEGEKHTMPSDLFTLGYIENHTPTIYNTTNNTNNVHKTINTTKNNTTNKNNKKQTKKQRSLTGR